MKSLVPILTALALSSALLFAQQPGPRDGERPRPPVPRDGEGPRPPGPFMRGQDPMMRHLFPPPLLFQAGEEIGLTEQQRNAIREELEKARDKVEPAQERLRQQMEAFGKLLSAEKVNEQQALEQLDKVLVAEAEVKVAHLTSLVRIKNLLTPEQQEKLRNWMRDHRPPGPPEGERGARPPFERDRGPGRGGERRSPPPPNE